jgi:hypothetical protein
MNCRIAGRRSAARGDDALAKLKDKMAEQKAAKQKQLKGRRQDPKVK